MRSLRLVTDCLLALLLPVLVCFVLTGRPAHEWLGLGMTVLLVTHHVMNRFWIRGLLRGRYNAARVIGTTVNVLMIADILVLLVTGIFLSKYALGFLGLKPYRPPHCHSVHITAAYWGLILMSLHIGMHAPWIAARLKLNRQSRGVRLACRAGCLAAAAYGAYAFARQGATEHLSAASHFVMCDTSPSVFFAETCAMVFFFAVFGNALRLQKR